MLHDFFLGFVKIHVLHHAAQEPVYGLALIDELRRHGYELGPSTIYPLLHGLEAAGYLAREDRVVGGKVRKYYAITEVGRLALAEAQVKISELVDELIEGLGPGFLPEPSADDEEEQPTHDRP